MKLNKVIFSMLFSMVIITNIFGKQEVVINFKNLEITNFVKIVSKILNKNILISTDIKGKVDFVTNKKVYKEDILNILIYVLEAKGFTLIENKNILRIVKLGDASKYNVPVYNNMNQPKSNQMVTEVFNIDFLNVDYISSKIRHLISKSAKLVTDKESNAIIITDFASNIQTIKKVIQIVAKDSKKDIQTVRLKNINGNTIIADLKIVAKSVFNEKIEKEKVAIVLNKNNNSIMFVGRKKNVNYLVNYLKNIDTKESLVKKTVEVIGLKNAESASVIKIINGIINQKVFKEKSNKPFVSMDSESNSIILMGPKDELDYFTQLISKLDTDRQQVYVQAKIVEVSESKTQDIGLKYGISGAKQYSSGLASFSASLSENAILPAVPAVSINKVGNYITNDILAMGVSLNLLNQNGAADIVSEPSLLCINNKKSTIYVGQTVSIKTASTKSTGAVASDTFQREDIGLTLSVKPRISNGNKVLLEITTKVEDVSKSSGANGQPDTSKKELETSAIVNDGESVILGGYIKNTNSQTIDKVPFFSDIPLIGSFFKNSREVKDKINLVVIITPYIVPKSKDLTYVRNKLAQLKLLENKFTKDAIFRLEKVKLRVKRENLTREKEKITLDKDTLDLKEEMLDFSKNKKDYYDDKKENQNKELTLDEKLHQERVKEMFGL